MVHEFSLGKLSVVTDTTTLSSFEVQVGAGEVGEVVGEIVGALVGALVGVLVKVGVGGVGAGPIIPWIQPY